MSEFAALLDRYRQRTGLGSNELARAIHCHPSYVSNLCNDRRGAPSVGIVALLADALALTADEADELYLAAGYASPRLRALCRRLAPSAWEQLLDLTTRVVAQFEAEGEEVRRVG